MKRDPTRVIINAEFAPEARPGGVQSVIMGLVKSLSQFADGDEEYVLVTHPDNRAWLEPFVGERVRVVNRPQRKPRPRESLHAEIRWRVRSYLEPVPRRLPEVPISKGFYESLGGDVIHFPFQDFTVCALPSIYNPHDLLHAHYPAFFDAWELAYRDQMYFTACRMSQVIVAGSDWVKEDVARHFGMDRGKIQVIPAAATTGYCEAPKDEAIAALRVRLGFEGPFCYYPAVTWGHKNHVRLLEAIALLRDRTGTIIRLASTGHRLEPEWGRIDAAIERLNLGGQIAFLGQIPFAELRALYQTAQFFVMPSLFEGLTSTIFEAWSEGLPVTCSSATSLPEQAADAALYFDPCSVESIASALARISSDAELREQLVQKGRARLARFTWERTGRAYRAVYRRAAGRELTEEEQDLLNWNWMRDKTPDAAAVTR